MANYVNGKRIDDPSPDGQLGVCYAAVVANRRESQYHLVNGGFGNSSKKELEGLGFQFDGGNLILRAKDNTPKQQMARDAVRRARQGRTRERRIIQKSRGIEL